MSTLGMNISTQDKPYTWSDVKPTVHPTNRIRALSVSLWKLSAEIDDLVSRADINEIQRIAQELDDYAEQDAMARDHSEELLEQQDLRGGL